MDDGLILNISTDEHAVKPQSSRKGGRWTDRLQAKRTAKRKSRIAETSAEIPASKLSGDDSNARPAKHPRIEKAKRPASAATEGPTMSHRQQSQIISSLFSFNPKVDLPSRTAAPKTPSQPSNAPVAGSTFSALGLDPLIIAHLSTKLNITKPTAIQRAALPALLTETLEETSSRDVFIQSQTGSGKTLSFLLPIIQDLLPLSSLSYIDRSIGTLAIIVAPTRELAKQLSDVLESLLNLRLRPEDELGENPDSSLRLTRWLVSGVLTGGATRSHEKARLRKGLPILVSTPGRLLDHLQNTSSFNVGKCRWLVLDEADRLMELGFEETITGIIQGLDGRRRLALKAVEEGKGQEVGGWDWERRRRTILCSATIRDEVQKLAGTALIDPLMIKATEFDKTSDVPHSETSALGVQSNQEKFTPPSQLSQKYLVVPLKLRLVALVALLRSLLKQSQGRKGTKVIVFLDCTDSVDFHWHLLGSSSMDDGTESQRLDGDPSDGESDDSTQVEDNKTKRKAQEPVEVRSSLLPHSSIFRLHGSLPTFSRAESLRRFSKPPSSKASKDSPDSSILLCTSVASRGLDLPLVRAVIQYDLPTEGGATEYVHRVGRTARAGKGGEAWCFVAPSEVAWIKWVEDRMRGETKNTLSDDKNNITLEAADINTVLGSGFGGNGDEYEERATQVQLSFERWVLKRNNNAVLARTAFLSHMRAYATHPSDEKHMFHVRHLHIGHLAKAFALREAPKSVSSGGKSPSAKKDPRSKARTKDDRPTRSKGWEVDRGGEAEKRMQEVVRSQGRLSKKGGVMMSSGNSEFQIAGGAVLEKLVGGLGVR